MKKVTLIMVAIVILLLTGLLPCQAQQAPWACPGDDEANGIYRICNYFPLTPGSQWQYTTGECHVVNSVHTCSSGYSGILYATNTYEYSPYMQNGEHGLLFAGCQYDEGEFEDGSTHFVLVPPSISIGEVVRILTDERGTMDVEFVALETINVPAGTFSTLKMQWTRQANAGGCSYKTTLWLAKGIGPVKMHRTDANPADCLGCMFVCDPDNDIVRLNTPAELVSFNLNQGTPKISASPMSVNLGSIRAGGTSNPRTVTIKNTGNGDLIINSITISGANHLEFIESDDCSIVPAKSTCPIIVTFAPQPPFGKKTAVMSISSNDPKKPAINVKLSGQAPPPKIGVSPKSTKFAAVEVGTTSPPKIVTIKNTGLSDLTVNAVTFGGTDAGEFSQTTDCTTLEKGSSCSIGVQFTPTSAGNKSAVLSIASNDPKKSTINLKLSGKGSEENTTASVSVTGSWNIYKTTNGTPGEEGPGEITLTQTGNSISGVTAGGVLITGTINGLNINMSWTDLATISCTGMLSADAKTMSGTWNASDARIGTWRAMKIQPISISDLVGTYNLIAFTIRFTGFTITEDDVDSFSGTMKIHSSGYATQTVTVEGERASASGTITVIDNDNLQMKSGECTYTAAYSYDGNIFTTTIPKGACGNEFSETDVWKKISSSVQSNNLTQEYTSNDNIKFGTVGGLIGGALR